MKKEAKILTVEEIRTSAQKAALRGCEKVERINRAERNGLTALNRYTELLRKRRAEKIIR